MSESTYIELPSEAGERAARNVPVWLQHVNFTLYTDDPAGVIPMREYSNWGGPQPDERRIFALCVACDEHAIVNDTNSHGGDVYCRECLDERFSSCADCGEYFDPSEVNAEGYCGSCAESNCDCPECRSDSGVDGDYRGRKGESLKRCSECNEDNLYMDDFTEEFICKCEYDKRLAAKKPVRNTKELVNA